MINKKNGIKCKIYFFDLFNHLLAGKKNILNFFWKIQSFYCSTVYIISKFYENWRQKNHLVLWDL